jgi:glycosyltransferase involved in cell wall biosynthesis
MTLDVSVVLPVFWREVSNDAVRDLGAALDSVLEQSYPGEFEVLVIDDGSASPVEGALARTSYVRHPHVRWIRLARNGGLVNALNVGLACAKYDLIARIDSDDSWRPGKIEKQARLLSLDPDLTIVGSGMRLVHENGDPDEDLVRPGDWEGILNFFVTVGCPFPHGSILARRSVFGLLGGYPHDPTFSHCEDYALWGSWVRFFKPAMVEEVLYEYTVSRASVSGQHNAQQRKGSGLIQQGFIDLGDWASFPAAMQVFADELGATLYEAGRVCFLLWKYRCATMLPQSAVQSLRTLLPDRRVVPCEKRWNEQPRWMTPLTTLAGRELPSNARACIQIM